MQRSWGDNHSPKVDMQEVAEVIAWIKSFPTAAGTADSRVLLSKDGTELYISIFTYDDGWLRYLQGGRAVSPELGSRTCAVLAPGTYAGQTT